MLCDIAYMQSLKIVILINLFTKQKQTHRLREFLITRGEGNGGVIDWYFGTDMYILIYL